MKKTYVRSRKHHPLKFLVVLGPIVLFFLKSFTNLNFMTDILIATSTMIIVTLLIRHDLLIDILLSGLLFAAVYTILLSIYIYLFPELLNVWNFEVFPQSLFVNVPLFEIIWAFLSAMFLGSFYEFSHELLLKTYNYKK